MKSTAPSRLTPAAWCLPFAQATPEQLAQAEHAVRDALGGKFPPVRRGTWATALAALQPDLWATADTVFLDAPDLARVADYLDALPAVVLARAGHGPRQLYYTRLPMNCPDEVLRALAELEADPRAGGHAVYELVAGVARRYAEAEQFGWTKSPAPLEADGTDSDQARATLLAWVAALDRARGVAAGNDPAENRQSR
ncbi:hypothetical protein ACFP2F_20685 [Hymenobacter artigasi]|uniref:Uncharacterized protein n=1 Tax=Hymenobacter artigasi TaxID=2719616 RepID=A0ABX1HQW1_9BACT|nr:hypothetical protein [Hymenobacter artigasi]NKI91583.1 hypothetical protein [Hymenobacter artigasi]